MKRFRVTRGSTTFEWKAESLEELEEKLSKHTEDFPQASPVTQIEEGRLFTAEEEEEMKREKLDHMTRD